MGTPALAAECLVDAVVPVGEDRWVVLGPVTDQLPCGADGSSHDLGLIPIIPGGLGRSLGPFDQNRLVDFGGMLHGSPV